MAGNPAGCDEDAESVIRSGDEPGDGPGFIASEDVAELRQPFIVVDGGTSAGVKPSGGDLENGVRDVIEPVSDFLAHHVTDDGNAKTAEEGQDSPGTVAHAVPPCGRRRAGMGGRYWSLSAASWTRAAVTASPAIV